MKRKKIKKLIFIILIPIILFGLYVIGQLVYGTITDYKAPPKKYINSEGNGIEISSNDSVFSFLIWNIGFGGLGSEISFFYDGGETVITPNDLQEKYFKGITKILQKNKDLDFILLQEVDSFSNRTHFLNQHQKLAQLLQNKENNFAINYKVQFVPIPIFNPLGKMNAGLSSFSKYKNKEAIRYALPGELSWPNQMYLLDRCLLFQRFSLPNNKDLIVINTHKSAYDNGTVKEQQMNYLRDIILKEYELGNYVVVGGDWNQCPPNFNTRTFVKNPNDPEYNYNIDFDFMPEDWLWIYDPKTPTNRKLNQVFDPETSFQTIIDFYLISPNLQAIKVETINTDFAFSDHQPVKLRVKIKNK